MTIALLTIFHERYELTEIYLRYYEWLQGLIYERLGHHLWLCGVITEGDSRMKGLLNSMNSWHWKTAPNRPLAAKWNSGMTLILDPDTAAMLYIGSDDFVDFAYMEHMFELLPGGSDVILINDCHFFDTKTHKCIYNVFTKVGAGRIISRAALDKVEWIPFRSKWEATDAAMDKRFRDIEILSGEKTKFTWEYVSTRETAITLLDVKTSQNNMTFEQMLGRPHTVMQAEKFLHDRFPSIAEDLLALTP